MTRTELIRQGPFRLFFPLGILCGILGVGHWTLWSIGWIKESNVLFHTTLQIAGFLTCFVVGFLMTALPRFLGTGEAKLWEVVVGFGTALAMVIFAFEKRWTPAYALFLLLLVLTLRFGLSRFPGRSKNPPPSFLLIAFGFLHAILGAAFMLAAHFGLRYEGLYEMGRQMLQIGFLLCLVLGIAGYLAPFLMGYAEDPSCDPGVTDLRGHNSAAISFHALTGFAILTTFWSEPRHLRLSLAFRAALVLLHLLLFAKIWRPVRKKSVQIYLFWISCWMVPFGLAWPAIWPDYRLAGLHFLFIGGYSLMIFSFALVVVLSHGSRPDLLRSRLIPLWIVGVAVLIAAVLRAVAELDAWRYQIWIHAASGTWILAAAFWLIWLLPKFGRPPGTKSLY